MRGYSISGVTSYFFITLPLLDIIMRVFSRFIGLLFLPVIISSCSTGACYDDLDPLLNFGLFTSGTGAVKKANTIKIIGELPPNDTILVDNKSVSSFSLMLNPAGQSVTLYITLDDVSDTAVISYDSYPHLVSAECGYTFYNEITELSTTHNIIDTLIIENKNVTLNGERNLRLFF